MRTIKISNVESERELNRTLSCINKFGCGGSDDANLVKSIARFYARHGYITQTQQVSLQKVQASSRSGR